MPVSSVAALLYAVVTAGCVAFQLALAVGAPWGSYAMGGRYPRRLPARCAAGCFPRRDLGSHGRVRSLPGKPGAARLGARSAVDHLGGRGLQRRSATTEPGHAEQGRASHLGTCGACAARLEPDGRADGWLTLRAACDQEHVRGCESARIGSMRQFAEQPRAASGICRTSRVRIHRDSVPVCYRIWCKTCEQTWVKPWRSLPHGLPDFIVAWSTRDTDSTVFNG